MDILPSYTELLKYHLPQIGPTISYTYKKVLHRILVTLKLNDMLNFNQKVFGIRLPIPAKTHT